MPVTECQLLPRSTLGPIILGVLQRFRHHAVAISWDIKAMFRQICLLPSDRPVLQFIWLAMQRTSDPQIFDWQVSPFGTNLWSLLYSSTSETTKHQTLSLEK